ncbi:head morphogenesis [Dinoroseobacter phage vB_DshS-R5C]|uniref:Head morphogenesis protein n=1 Tax=Dinoroseobacter phage vB_DshS-R5C TaxID=1965368 RepID=A0A1V0DY89_9CAUD|nr:head morphogenesis [Dinoroseobacter phage vB_DshS-R5C]ARB06098.1 head morphogenesis protein [Dinoroseobacter phage vB_DshS-R5C]
MASINERFMDFQVAQQIRWIRLQNRDVREALQMLRRSEKDIEALLRRTDLTNYNQARLNALRQQIVSLVQTLEATLTPVLINNVDEAARLAAEIEAQAFLRIMPAGLDVTTPNPGVIATAATSAPFNGAKMDDWAKSYFRSLETTTWSTILDGVTQGMTNDELVRAVRGTRSRRYMDGALQPRRRGLETLVRTSTNHATNQGRQAVWEANEGLISGVRWVSTLDTRTTPICRERDGKVGPVSPSDDWKPPNGAPRLHPPMARPPAHPNCRSTTVAVTKSWRELGFDMDELPSGTRASMDGQVPANITYFEWLNRQSAATQEEVLGPARLRLWREGGITPDRFQNDEGHFYTLAELRRRQPQAFKDADL